MGFVGEGGVIIRFKTLSWKAVQLGFKFSKRFLSKVILKFNLLDSNMFRRQWENVLEEDWTFANNRLEEMLDGTFDATEQATQHCSANLRKQEVENLVLF